MATKVPTKTKKPKAATLAAGKATGKRPARATTPVARTPAARSNPSQRSIKELQKLAKNARSTYVPRAMPSSDDDDVLMAHGAGGGAGFGRCGGRLLGSRLEQTLCDRLSQAGVAHSHSPRHFEVRLEEESVGAYAPMIVLRGRGREGKSVVIEAADEAESSILRKVVAFRSQYGQEFYVILVATEEVLDEVALAAYDEACSQNSVNTLIARLAE